MGEVAKRVRLAVDADRLWRDVCTLEGVNRELAPILRMTAPPGLERATIDELRPGEPAGRSWLLLGGVFPVEYDDLCLVEVEPRRFLERSRMLTMDPWEHERTIEPTGEGTCRLTDRLRFEPRGPLGSIPGVGRLAAAIVAALFGHRHRRLAKLYGLSTDR
ncbi:MAG TPA: hypothetical protein VFH44_10580 [Solirubrobacterales bacterium]|nr:hypothetical protein [Solirubrobacterales bacterium]